MTDYKSNFERTKEDPPIPGQGCTLVSFLPFNEPKKTETGDTVYGFLKIRGTYSGTHVDNKQAIDAAHKLIREFDSVHQIQCIPVGKWVPYTLNSSHVAEKIDVKMDPDNKEEVHLRDLATKELQTKNKAIARELKEREEDVSNNDMYDNRDSLDFYVMKRNVLTTLRDNERSLIAKLEDVRNKTRETLEITKNLDAKFPEYSEKWVDRYNEKRREVRIPDYIEPEGEKQWYNDTKL